MKLKETFNVPKIRSGLTSPKIELYCFTFVNGSEFSRKRLSDETCLQIKKKTTKLNCVL